MQPRNSEPKFSSIRGGNASQRGVIEENSVNLELNSSQHSLLWRQQNHFKDQNQHSEEEKLSFQEYSFNSQVHYSKNEKFSLKESSFDSQTHCSKSEKLNLTELSFNSQLHYLKNTNNKNDSISRKGKPQWRNEKSRNLYDRKERIYKEISTNSPVRYTNLKREPSSDKVLKEDTTIKSYDSQILFDDTNKIYQSDQSNLLDLSNSKSRVELSILNDQGEKQRDYLSVKDNESVSMTRVLELTEIESHSQTEVCHTFQIGQCQKGKSNLLYHPKQKNVTGLDNGSRLCNAKNLPTDSIWKEIGDELNKSNKRFCLIRGEPGSEKSTQIPQYLYEKIKFSKYKIIYVQPTKVTAINLARKVAEELGVKLGNQVGHQLRPGRPYEGTYPEVIRRADNLFTENTKILFMSEEILLDKIISECKKRNGKNKLFKNTKAIFLDEIDERSLFSELILGMLKKTFLVLYPHMKIFLVSPIVDAERYKNHFSNCRVIPISGRKFPVQIIYKPMFENNYIDGTIEVLKEVIDKKEKGDLENRGHILVFLPDANKIEKVRVKIYELDNEFDDNYVINILHNSISTDEQEALFDTTDKRTKIILATKLAEDSITINGVQIVIDSGFDKDSYHDSKTRITVLKNHCISQEFARLRAGRAGRTSPGICYRLYSENTFDRLGTHKIPEIARVNLEIALLKIVDCGLDPFKFPYFEPPAEQVIRDTLKTLNILGALDEDNKITIEGRFMVQMSTEPRKTKAIIQACQRGCLEEILIIFAMEVHYEGLSKSQDKEEIQRVNKNRIEDDGPYQSDHLDFLDIFRGWEHKFKNYSSYIYTGKTQIKIRTFENVKRMVEDLTKEVSIIKKKDSDIEKLLEIKVKGDVITDTKVLKCLTSSCFSALGKFSGCNDLGFVNILDGSLFKLHSTSNLKDYLFPIADIPEKFAIYSQIEEDVNGANYAQVVSFIPSSWLDDETIIPYNLRNEFKNSLKENYKYNQTHYELPRWAIRKFNKMHRDKIDEWANKLEEIKGQNVKFIISRDTMVTFVHSKDI